MAWHPKKDKDITVGGKKLGGKRYRGYWLCTDRTSGLRCHGHNTDGSRCNRTGNFLKVERWDGKVIPALCGLHVTHQCEAMIADGKKRCNRWVWQMDRFCVVHQKARCRTEMVCKPRKRYRAPSTVFLGGILLV